jgi:hypothetical protein
MGGPVESPPTQQPREETTMTKKHFIQLAKIIDQFNWTDTYDQRARMANTIADMLAGENPRFDRGRFLAACGVES